MRLNASRILVSPGSLPLCARVAIGGLLVFLAESRSTSIDLSKATQLNSVWPFGPTHRGLTGSPRSSEASHPSTELFDVSRFICPTTRSPLVAVPTPGKPPEGQWPDLDCLLAQFLEPCPIRPALTRGDWVVKNFVACLLPETTRRGTFDPLVGCPLATVVSCTP